MNKLFHQYRLQSPRDIHPFKVTNLNWFRNPKMSHSSVFSQNIVFEGFAVLLPDFPKIISFKGISFP